MGGSRVSQTADKRLRERGAGCCSQERGTHGGRNGVQHRGEMAELGERGNESAGAQEEGKEREDGAHVAETPTGKQREEMPQPREERQRTQELEADRENTWPHEAKRRGAQEERGERTEPTSSQATHAQRRKHRQSEREAREGRRTSTNQLVAGPRSRDGEQKGRPRRMDRERTRRQQRNPDREGPREDTDGARESGPIGAKRGHGGSQGRSTVRGRETERARRQTHERPTRED